MPAYRASSPVNARCDDIQAKMFAFPSASVADLRFHRNRALLTVNKFVTYVVIEGDMQCIEHNYKCLNPSTL